MATDAIINKIKADAENDAGKAIEEAKNRAKTVLEEGKKETDRAADDIKARTEADIAALKERSALMTRLDIRKQTLAAQRAVLDQVFSEAEERLANMSDDEKSKFITDFIVSAAVTGNETLCVPEGEKRFYSQNILVSVNRELKSKGLPGQLTIDDVPAPFSHGVMIRGEHADINGDFHVLIEEVRATCEREVADILFDHEVS